MGLIFLVIGTSVCIVLLAVAFDYGIQYCQEKVARNLSREQALKTLTAACHLKNGFIEKHQPHGNHRRVKVS